MMGNSEVPAYIIINQTSNYKSFNLTYDLPMLDMPHVSDDKSRYLVSPVAGKSVGKHIVHVYIHVVDQLWKNCPNPVVTHGEQSRGPEPGGTETSPHQEL